MGSLYEPSIRSSTWTDVSQRLSRRFTTLSGWRELGLGVYAMGSSNIRMFSIRHQFDPEEFRYRDFDFSAPRDAPPVPSVPSYVSYRRSSEGTIGKAIGSVQGLNVRVVNEGPTVFTRREKLALGAIVGATGVFPAMSFNVFLPALTRVAADLRISLEAVNLSVMVYLLVQAVAPLFWGPLADALGRRTVFIYSFTLYIVASIALSFSPNLAVLIVFRGLQSAGVASIVSVGCSVITDLFPPAEREHMLSVYQGIRNGALVLAPAIGGLATNYINFRCVFVIVFGLSLAVLAAILFFLPETLPSVAGNGTLPLVGIDQPWIWRCRIFGKPAHVDEAAAPGQHPTVDYARFRAPFRLLREKDVVMSLVFKSVVFAIWMMVTVSTAGLFKAAFGLSDVLLGLAFIPNAVGTIAGSALIGNLLNQDFGAACAAYRKTHALPPSVTISRQRLPADFPLEHTRLLRLPALTAIFMLALSFYGFTLYYPSLTSLGGWISIPLLLQFLIAAMTHAICGVHQTLIGDLWPWDGPAAATTSSLARCVLGGVGAAVIQKMLERVEVGPTFLALGLVVLILVPLPMAQWYWGPDWRRARDAGPDPEKV